MPLTDAVTACAELDSTVQLSPIKRTRLGGNILVSDHMRWLEAQKRWCIYDKIECSLYGCAYLLVYTLSSHTETVPEVFISHFILHTHTA